MRSNSFAALGAADLAAVAAASSPPSPGASPTGGGSTGGGRRRRRARTASLAECSVAAPLERASGPGSATGGAAAPPSGRRPAMSEDDGSGWNVSGGGQQLPGTPTRGGMGGDAGARGAPTSAAGPADSSGAASDGGLPSSWPPRPDVGSLRRPPRLPTIVSPADPAPLSLPVRSSPATASAVDLASLPPAAPTGRTVALGEDGGGRPPPKPAGLSAPLSPGRARPPAVRSPLAAYIHALLHPPPAPLPLVPGGGALPPWGQTERQRVYNALLAVPYQLERLLWFGGCVCADAWGAVFTALPIRCVGAACRAGRAGAALLARRPPPPWPRAGADLYDAACAAIFVCAAGALCAVPGGALYFWMKDLTQEFLKLHVIYTAIEIGDKIGCSFAVDALDALAGTCAAFAAARSRAARLALLPSLAADASVSAALVTGHGLVLMCHGMALAVAMHSTRGHTLVALTIAANFVELKGTVFKRYDGAKLFNLAAQDVVERFHLVLALAFVLVEAAAASGGGVRGAVAALAATASSSSPTAPSPPSRFTPVPPFLLRRCAQVLGAEVIIDLLKHAVVCKFNDVRPGMYREFFKDVCEAVVDGSGDGGGGGGGDGPAPSIPTTSGRSTAAGSRPQAGARLLVFDPLAAAAFAVRLAVGLSGGERWTAASVAGVAAAFAVACAAKVVIGYGLRVAALAYLGRYARVHGVMGGIRGGGGGGGGHHAKRE